MKSGCFHSTHGTENPTQTSYTPRPSFQSLPAASSQEPRRLDGSSGWAFRTGHSPCRDEGCALYCRLSPEPLGTCAKDRTDERSPAQQATACRVDRLLGSRFDSH